MPHLINPLFAGYSQARGARFEMAREWLYVVGMIVCGNTVHAGKDAR